MKVCGRPCCSAMLCEPITTVVPCRHLWSGVRISKKLSMKICNGTLYHQKILNHIFRSFPCTPLKPPNSWCLQYIHFLLGIKLLSMTDVASFSCMCCTPNLSKHNELKWLFSSLLSCETELIAIRTAV